MPKNKVIDPITDQEIAFARLVLSGNMTDHQAAESVGLNPSSAAYTKSKPRVRAYMFEHRAATQQQIVQQEAEGLRRFSLDREQVLARLWEIANLSHEVTRGSLTGQVKALSMIVAIEGLIPNRRAVSAQNHSAPPPNPPQIYVSAWRAGQHATTTEPQSDPVPAQQEDPPEVPEPDPASGSGEEAPSPSPSTFPNRFNASEAQLAAPYIPIHASISGRSLPLSIKGNPFSRPR